MSSGPFVLSTYETDNGDLVPIKLQPETLTATFAGTANAAPAGAVTPGFPSADVSRSKKSIGIHARTVSVKITDPADPAGLPGLTRIAVPNPTVYNAIVKGAAVVCSAGTGTVAGKSSETIV